MVKTILLTLILLTSVPGCGGPATEPATPTDEPTPVAAQTLTIFGPDGAEAIFNRFEPLIALSGLPYDARVIEGPSVPAGVQGVLDGVFDIMILTRRPRPDEPLAYVELAHTPVIVFLNPELGLQQLSHQQITQIFAGAISNWAEVGGPDQDITVLILPDSELLTQAVRDQILGDTPFPDDAILLPFTADMVDMARALPGTIGYELWAGKKVLDFGAEDDYSGVVFIDGMTPDGPDYPYSVSIGWAYLPEKQAFLQPLLDWTAEITCSELGYSLAQQFGVFTSCPESSQ